MKPKTLLPFVLLALLAGGCTRNDSQTQTPDPSEFSSSQAPSSQRPLIYASNYPLHYFTQRLIGSHAEVRLPRESGSDPSNWKPSRNDVRDMQTAHLIVLNGAQYEAWRPQVTLEESRCLDTTADLQSHLITLEEAVIHRHGNSEEHSHEGLATFTWLNLQLATRQAETIYNRLLVEFPQQAPSITQEWHSLRTQLLNLDTQFQEFFDAFDPRPNLWTSHPVYPYFGQRFGLTLKSMHWEPDQHPSSSEWEKFREAQTSFTSGWMLWEAKPLPETQTELESLGVQSIVFYPGGGWPPQGDFLTTQEENLRNLRRLATPKTP